jgi:hypothetical protein
MLSRHAVVLALCATVAAPALLQAQDFTTSLTTKVLRGPTAVLQVRITHPINAQKIASLAIHFTKDSPGSKPNFSILVDHAEQVLKVADGNGQIVNPYLILEDGRKVLTPAFSSSGVVISEYNLTRTGNNYSLDLKVTRPSVGDADLDIALVASDGGSPSLPGDKVAAGLWKLRGSVCEPTARQLANRASRESIPMTDFPRLPDPGQKYCDPTFGTEVMRVSDIVRDAVVDYTNNGNVVGPLGQFGFNKNSTRFGLFTTSGLVRLYTLDPEELTASGGKYLYPVVYNARPLSFNSSTLVWSGSSAADAPDTILFGAGMSIYKVNVTQPVNGQYRAQMIADFSKIFDSSKDTNPKNYGVPSLMRCTASRDTLTFGCSIMIATPAGAYPRIGYIVARLYSHATDRPTTNWQIKAQHINGIDSDDMAGYQTVELPGSDDKAHTYTLTSPYEPGLDERGGYKFSIDKSGRFALFGSWDPQGEAGKYNTNVVLDLEKVANGDQPFSFLQAGGHGDVGYGIYVGMNTAYGTCGSCMKTWDLATLNSDPVVTENNGTPITSPLGYSYARQYNSAFANGDQTAVVLACPLAGCTDNPAAFAGEVFNLDTTGVDKTTRLARLNNVIYSDDYVELQPIQSPDGRFTAFTTNYGDRTGKKYVMIVRVPQPEN